MKKRTPAAISLAIVLVLAACVYWYNGAPVAEAKLEQLQYCKSKQSVTDLLGSPTSTNYGNGNEYWVYHGHFLGIRTLIHLDVIFTNDTYCSWVTMD